MAVVKVTEIKKMNFSGIERFNLDDIEKEARRIIAAAKAERDRILADAAVEIEQQRKQVEQEGRSAGHKAGFAEGHKAGTAQALEEAQEKYAEQTRSSIEMMQQVLGQFDQVKQNLIWQAEQGVVALVLAIAEKVIKQSGKLDANITMENVKAALELVNQRTDVRVQVHPSHLEAIEKLLGSTDKAFGSFASITVEACEDVLPGGCCLTTEHGGVDAQLETQIDRIVAQLMMTDTKGARTAGAQGEAEVEQREEVLV
ncbi:MAG: hypothetical protein JW936_05295 [Sedimentisphaerales bacterium]|nr:hypothetical protein [Sedimentisphaerales bacterium]